MPTCDQASTETPDLVARAMDIAFQGASPRIAAQLPSHIGQYRVTGWIGEGGMGTVYKAEQPHPHRTIALKVIRSDRVTPRAMIRLQYEAEVLGKLIHPGIATVYEAATWTDGNQEHPFIAMELIAGAELPQYAEKNQLDVRQRLELIAKVCDAVEHAHRNGFIHRDLKPSNILVLPDGRPKVLDFGLARAISPEIRLDQTPVSVEGAIPGTPLYMSPEQLAGDSGAIDTRSDVYSLGVVAFQLLAGRLPYDLPSVPSFQDIRTAVLDRESTRLARLDKRFRGDVTTIIFKTLEKERNSRYQSAAELAADIRRFLAGEPIAARRITAVERVWKSCRRNPALAVLSAAVIVLVLALAVGGPILAVQAVRARRQAEARAAETREVLDYMTQVSADKLDGKQSVSAVRTEILERVLQYYQRHVQEEGGHASVLDLAEADFQLGYVTEKLGRLAEARIAYERAVPLLTGLVQNHPSDRQIRRRLAETYTNLSNVESALARFDRTRQLLNLALDQWQALAALEPESVPTSRDLAVNFMDRGLCNCREGRYAEGEAQYKQALTGLTGIAEKAPQDASVQHMLAILHRNMGKLYYDTDRYAEAQASFQSAIGVCTRLLQADAGDTRAQWVLGWSYSYLGVALGYLNSPEEGLQAQQKAEDIQRNLVEQFPLANVYREDLGRTLHNRGFALLKLGRFDEAEPILAEATRERRRLFESQPDNLAWRCGLANSLIYLAQLREIRGHPADSAPDLEEAVTVLQGALRIAPQHLETRRVLRRAYSARGQSLYALGKLEAAVESFDGGLAQHADLAKVYVGPDDRNEFAKLHDGRARALADLGSNEQAVASFQTAALQWLELGGAEPAYNAGCDLALCVPLVPEEARGSFVDRALAALRSALDQGFSDLDHVKTDPDLNSIRSRPEFLKLLESP